MDGIALDVGAGYPVLDLAAVQPWHVSAGLLVVALLILLPMVLLAADPHR